VEQAKKVNLELTSMVEVQMTDKNTFVAILAALQKRGGDMLVACLIF